MPTTPLMTATPLGTAIDAQRWAMLLMTDVEHTPLVPAMYLIYDCIIAVSNIGTHGHVSLQ